MDEKIAKSRAQEQRVAKRTGGSTNMGSGNGWQRKHDVRSPGILWEMKRTDSRKSITLKLEDLESVRRISWQEGTRPVMHLETYMRSYVMQEEQDYFEDQEELAKLREPTLEAVKDLLTRVMDKGSVKDSVAALDIRRYLDRFHS